MLLKNITISGLGGVGGYYGAMLVEAARREGLGRTISFVARGAHRAAIEERGLHVHTPERDFTVRPDYLAEDPHDLPPTDLLILATKSYDLKANIQQLRPIITPRTIILPSSMVRISPTRSRRFSPKLVSGMAASISRGASLQRERSS